MMEFRRIPLCPCLLLLAVLCGPALAAEPDTPAGRLPAGAVIFAELSGAGPVLDEAGNSPLVEDVLETPQYRQYAETSAYRKAQAAQQIIETQLGAGLASMARKLFGDRVAFAVYPREPQPAVLVLVRTADAADVAEFRKRLEPFLILAEDQVTRTETIGGAEVFEASGVVAAFDGRWMFAGNDRDLLMKALDTSGSEGTVRLADDEKFAASVAQTGADHLLRVYFDTAVLGQKDGKRVIPEKLDNPLASLLFGGWVELAGRSPYAAVSLDVADAGFVLSGWFGAPPGELGEPHSVFFSDPKGQGTPPIPQPAGLVAGVTLWRDLDGWYTNREKLLVESALPGFDQFESGLANLLPGKDFGTDVLPLLGDHITFVAAPQSYEHLDGEPGVKLPGFAALISLADPEKGSQVLQLFFQTVAAVSNLVAGQQGREPWILGSEDYKGVQILYGRYLKPPSGERLPVVFNFLPAAALVGDRYIISSSVGLCRQLIDELQQPATADARENRNLDLELHPAALADVLDSNREVAQAQRIQQGQSAEQAEREFDLLLSVLRRLKTARFSTSVQEKGYELRLQGGLE